MLPINQWSIYDRPREKLLLYGADSLSDAELLAIFLRTGVQGQTALDLASALLEQFDGLNELMAATQNEFCEKRGLGPAKYAQLQAVLELSRRYLASSMARGKKLNSPAETRDYLMTQLKSYQYEVFAVLFLDSQNQIIEFEILFTGTIDSATVHPREVVKRSLHHNASAVILAHNHPSGISEPSDADIQITEHLKQALELIDIQVLDHFIVGDGQPTSFLEYNLL